MMNPPYGPAENTLRVLRQWRATSHPQKVDEAYLAKLGISPNLMAPNLAALAFLGFTDSEGKTTQTAVEFVKTSSDQYPAFLARILREVYAPVFEVCDPAAVPRERIEDAFRGETPHGQRDRMATLFLGLCKEAGIVSSTASRPKSRPSVARNAAVVTRVISPRQGSATQPKPQSLPPQVEPAKPGHVAVARGLSDLHPSILGVLGILPEIETIEEFDQWSASLRSIFALARRRNLDGREATTP